jgi:subtilase family serine protease
VSAVALVAIAAFALPIGHATVASGSSSTVRYAVGKRACSAAVKPGTFTCYAIREQFVSKGTPGAVAVPKTIRAGKANPQTVGPHGGLTPLDLNTAYGTSTATGGSGSTIAIVDAYNDPDIASDLATFDSQYGLPACTIANGCFKVVNQTGGSTLPSNDTTGWSDEETLDVETVHSVCPKCHIVLVEASDATSSDLATAVNTAVSTEKATVVSNSYGGTEDGDSSSDNAAYNHTGVPIVASTGDDGYYSFDALEGIDETNVPAALPTVVAVGGTSLYLNQTGGRQSETVWNDNGPQDVWEEQFLQSMGATGGGCSALFKAQSWQTSLSDWSSTDCGKFRLPADVSALADYLTGLDTYSSYSCSQCATGWNTYGGTSLAAPIIASMFGLVGGGQGVKYPALTLYGHHGTSAFYDVTVGGNGWCDGEGAAQCGNPNQLGYGVVDCDYPASGSTPSSGDTACDAQPGYDGPSGLGTPNGLTAFEKTGPGGTISGPTSIKHGKKGSWTPKVNDPFPGGSLKAFTWKWGDGSSATSNTGGATPHTFASAGTYTIQLTVTDSYAMSGTVKLKVTVS